MHAFARPSDVVRAGREPSDSAALRRSNDESVRPNAPRPPTCKRSRRVMPSQSVFGDPRMRSKDSTPRWERERRVYTSVTGEAGGSPAPETIAFQHWKASAVRSAAGEAILRIVGRERRHQCHHHVADEYEHEQ